MRIPRPGNREHARYKLFPSCGGRRPVAEKVGVVHPDVSSAGCCWWSPVMQVFLLFSFYFLFALLHTGVDSGASAIVAVAAARRKGRMNQLSFIRAFE